MSRRHHATIYRVFGNREYAISGTVIFGTTSAMGPNPDEIVDLGIEDENGNPIEFLAWIRDMAGNPADVEDEIERELWAEAKRNWREQ